MKHLKTFAQNWLRPKKKKVYTLIKQYMSIRIGPGSKVSVIPLSYVWHLMLGDNSFAA